MSGAPVRTCLGCRRARPKATLLRLVRRGDGVVVADPTGRTAGRGAYVCGDAACLERVLQRARLAHAFRKPCEVGASLGGDVRVAGRSTAEASAETGSEEVRGLWQRRK